LSESSDTAKFTDYPLNARIMKDIAAEGFVSPTPVQAEFILPALAGKDLIGVAQTGTGKTAAFALPIVQRIGGKMGMCCLVLAPTRELARQTADMFGRLGRSSGIRTATIVGGIPFEQDEKALAQWPNVLVATPGRLIDHIAHGTIDLAEIEVLVVDEADRMHDMGFIPQVRRILDALPEERQTLMLTATMPSDVENIVRRCMKDAVRIQVGRRAAPAERAEQNVFLVDERGKDRLLVSILKDSEGRVLVFVRTKRAANRVASVVGRRIRSVTRLHSNRTQEERDDAMAGFRDGKYRVLVATDIAARGLDVADIEHVINYDFPHYAGDYVHRIGRTARAAAAGKATSFASRSDRRFVEAVERLIGAKLPLTPAPEGGHGGPRSDRRPPRGRSSRPRSAGGSSGGGRRPERSRGRS